jgi:polyribonucleotide nucleotidyltransferase
VLNVGDTTQVKVMEIDGQGRVNLSRKAVLAPGSENSGGGGRESRGNGEFRPQRPRRDDEEPAGAVPAGPGAPPTRRRRRPPTHRDDE